MYMNLFVRVRLAEWVRDLAFYFYDGFKIYDHRLKFHRRRSNLKVWVRLLIRVIYSVKPHFVWYVYLYEPQIQHTRGSLSYMYGRNTNFDLLLFSGLHAS